MTDDPRIKRVLKRYRRGEKFSDGIMDVTRLGLDEILALCCCSNVEDLDAPKELDDGAVQRLSVLMGIEFDRREFDYFLHSYVRSEFYPAYCNDPTVTSKPPPESGPPAKIPLPKGMRWVSVRPENGQEHYEAHPVEEPSEKAVAKRQWWQFWKKKDSIVVKER